MYLPYGVQSAEATPFDVGEHQEMLTSLLSQSKKQVARKTSMAEAIKMGILEGQ